MKKRILSLTLAVMVIVVTLIGCGGNETTKNETQIEEVETLKSLICYKECYKDGLLEQMSNNKNKEYEMKVGIYETYDDMVEEYLKTFVSLETKCHNQEKHMSFNIYGSGNIYDIDKEYMYIITCAHNFETSKFDTQKYIKITFINNETISINSDCLYIHDNGQDVALIKIPLSLISQDILNIVKTININNFFNTPLDEFYSSKLYCFKFKDSRYNVNYIEPEEQMGHCYSFYNSLEKGTSGGGIIDVNGNYYGMVLNEGLFHCCILPLFNEILVKEQ